MGNRNLYVVAYDVCDDKRLRKTRKVMLGYGDPLQYSVFACLLSKAERERLLGDLQSTIHHNEDRVMIVDLGPADGTGQDRIRFLGRSDPTPTDEPTIV